MLNSYQRLSRTVLRSSSTVPNASGRALSLTVVRRAKDPWPLPHTPQHLASTTTPDVPPAQPIPRPNESVETTRARLLYQSRKRGTLESDLLLSTFARDHLDAMSHDELREYDKVRPGLVVVVVVHRLHDWQFLDEPDWDIYYWATGNRTPPGRWAASPLLQKIRLHAKNEGKVVRSMPPLS